jgi:Tol biopolymer transport system component
MIVFSNGVQRSSLWQLPIDHDRGKLLPAAARRLWKDHSDRHSPSLSANGKRLVYVRRGLEGFEIHARDLDSGDDRIVTQLETQPRARISPDGATIAINQRGVLDDEKVIQLAPWSGGELRTLCGSCGLIYDWSPDGRRILYRSGKPVRFSDVDIATARQRVVAFDPEHSLGAAVLSRDERWLAIHYEITANIRPIYLAPVRDGVALPREQWIRVMDRPGVHVRPWWSPNGQFLYFLSDADGKAKLWAQPLSPTDKTAVGQPYILYAPPEERLTVSASAAFGPAIARAGIIFQMIETNTNIWLGE